jgi:spore germination protein GerM
LSIEGGGAAVDFSPEMGAYGGDALRAALIRAQIEQTLKQFDGVTRVRITVEGASDSLLEP